MSKDYYKILGVSRDADDATIKKVFRKLAKKYHPDTNGGNQEAEKLFREINEAYSVLSDAAKRKKYDEDEQKPQDDAAYQGAKSSKTSAKTTNPFAGFTAQNFKMDFGDMMFEELNNKKKENNRTSKVDFNDVSSQFSSFFGFRP